MVTLTISIKEEIYDRIRDIEVETEKTKQEIIRQLIQFGFAYCEKEKINKEPIRRNINR